MPKFHKQYTLNIILHENYDHRLATLSYGKCQCTGESPNIPVADAPRYSEETGYGYDLVATPEKGSKAPFFFSVRVPDGNYQVTVRLGSKKQAGVTTVRGESRRLFIDNLATKKGQFVDETFIINKRNPRISEKESVRIKPREKAKLNWDDKLTLEFNGDAPVCQSISIKPADPSVITVFLCGNSTVVDQDNEPWASWGQMIPHFFGTDVCIANYAESGESANTFIAAGRLKKALSQIKKGDYLFMEFGHNDQKQKGPGKGAYYSFMTSLKTFIDEAVHGEHTPYWSLPPNAGVSTQPDISVTHTKIIRKPCAGWQLKKMFR